MIRLLSRDHPAANPSPLLPLCPTAGQRGRGGEGLAEVQLPHIFQDGVSPFAPEGGLFPLSPEKLYVTRSSVFTISTHYLPYLPTTYLHTYVQVSRISVVGWSETEICLRTASATRRPAPA